MPFHITVLYPNTDDLKFDLNYYLTSHMPLVQKNFGKHGLKSWDVTDYKPGQDGSKPQYAVGATLVFDSPDQFAAAAASPDDAGPVFGDIPNFTNVKPILLGGEVHTS